MRVSMFHAVMTLYIVHHARKLRVVSLLPSGIWLYVSFQSLLVLTRLIHICKQTGVCGYRKKMFSLLYLVGNPSFSTGCASASLFPSALLRADGMAEIERQSLRRKYLRFAHNAIWHYTLRLFQCLLGKSNEVLMVGVHVGELDIDIDEEIIFALLFSFPNVRVDDSLRLLP